MRRHSRLPVRADPPAAVRPITFHELRHTSGTRMAAAGVPLRTIKHWMGHADTKTTQVYAHYQPSATEVEVIDAAFESVYRCTIGHRFESS